MCRFNISIGLYCKYIITPYCKLTKQTKCLQYMINTCYHGNVVYSTKVRVKTKCIKFTIESVYCSIWSKKHFLTQSLIQ